MTGKIIRSDAEWRRRLTPEQYRITRLKETEPAHSGWYRTFDGPGAYCCVCCGEPVFHSRDKFRAPSPWPAFRSPAASRCVRERKELFHLVIRSEVLCSRCDAHLGYQVEDRSSPTGRRYLINSLALSFFEEQQEAVVLYQGRHGRPLAGCPEHPAGRLSSGVV